VNIYFYYFSDEIAIFIKLLFIYTYFTFGKTHIMRKLNPILSYVINIFRITKVIFLILSIISVCSCKKDKIPALTTINVSRISQVNATSGGKITNFNKAKIIASGVCWSTSREPTIEDNKTTDEVIEGIFNSTLTGLIPETTYYLRAYATNGLGTVYGRELIFRTLKAITVTDSDGNEYNAVTINNQSWMTENLKTTKYNDGASIPLVEEDAAWSGLLTPGYCWYRNDAETYKSTYGAFYNWYTVNTGRLCPTGWHVASDAEWTILSNYLGGESIAGAKLKKTGRSHWVEPNTGATNETGFTALPGGLRYHDGLFHDFGFSGYWWSSTELGKERAYFRYMSYTYSNLFRFDNLKKIGFSVRCIQDK
jgi:uncharacterized protein (TIGR02145 family)